VDFIRDEILTEGSAVNLAALSVLTATFAAVPT
jgi:hypothetical protein